jgi:hypothetical protein
MSIPIEEARLMVQEAGEAGARKVLQEMGIRTDTPEALEHAQDTWRWATRQRRMQTELARNARTAVVWTLVASGLAALGYGAVHLLWQAADASQHGKDAVAAAMRSLGRFA